MCSLFCWRKSIDTSTQSPGFPIVPNEQLGDALETRYLEDTLLYSCLCQHKYGDAVDVINRRQMNDIEAMNSFRTIVNGRYLLHMCVKEGSEGVERVIEACLQAGADIDCKDFHGHTPLTLACLLGKASIIEFLLAHNANSCASTKSGETALHMLCYATCNKPDIADKLIKYGANIDAVDNDGNSVLHICAWLNQYDLISYFVEKGCSMNACNKQWRTPLMVATSCSNSRSHVVSTLLELDASVDDTDCNGMNAFVLAAGRYPNAGEEILYLLAKKGIDIYATGNVRHFDISFLLISFSYLVPHLTGWVNGTRHSTSKIYETRAIRCN